MSANFPQKEAAMYPIIRDYFRNTQKCDHVFVDDVDEVFVRLKKSLHIREVDVAALKDPDGRTSQIHLVEAKSLTKGQSVEECFSQIDSVRDSGDRLWVAFPEAQWKSLPQTDRERHEKRLRDFDFGLLLVTAEECYAAMKAPPNREVTESGRSEVLQQLGFATDRFLPRVSTLGSVEAQQAAGIMALTSMVADILYEIQPKQKRRRVTFHNYFGILYDDSFVTNGWFVPNLWLSESVYCELDPFGRLLGDGAPAAWVEVDVPIEEISTRLERDSGFGTHVYVDDADWRWKMIPVADKMEAVKYWVDRGLNETANLCVRIEISARMKSSLKSELERVINEAQQFLSLGADKTPIGGKKPKRTSP